MEQLLNIVKEFQNLEKQVIKNICIEMNWIKLFFAHDAAYSDSKDLAKKLFQIRF